MEVRFGLSGGECRYGTVRYDDFGEEGNVAF